MEPVVGIARPKGGISSYRLRADCARDTQVLVQRNVNGHVHVTIGNSEATLILHPHAAARLVANIQAVLKGEDFAHV